PQVEGESRSRRQCVAGHRPAWPGQGPQEERTSVLPLGVLGGPLGVNLVAERKHHDEDRDCAGAGVGPDPGTEGSPAGRIPVLRYFITRFQTPAPWMPSTVGAPRVVGSPYARRGGCVLPRRVPIGPLVGGVRRAGSPLLVILVSLWRPAVPLDHSS